MSKNTGNRAAANNRSNQMNPNNASYHRGRGASESQASTASKAAGKSGKD